MGRPALNVNLLTPYYDILKLMCFADQDYVSSIAKQLNKTPDTILKQIQVLEKKGYVTAERQKLMNIKRYKPSYNKILKGLLTQDLERIQEELVVFNDSPDIKKQATSLEEFLSKNIDKLANSKYAEVIVEGLFEIKSSFLWKAYNIFLNSLKLIQGTHGLIADPKWRKYALLLSNNDAMYRLTDYLEEQEFFKPFK